MAEFLTARKDPGPCVVHKYHWPPCTEPDVHHIWPTGEGGPDTPENKVVVCPTGHRNIHEYIRAWLRYVALPKVTRKEKELAESGLRLILGREKL